MNRVTGSRQQCAGEKTNLKRTRLAPSTEDYRKKIGEMSFLDSRNTLQDSPHKQRSPRPIPLNSSQPLLHLFEPHSRVEHNQSMRIDNANRRVGLREKQGKLFCFVYIGVIKIKKNKGCFCGQTRNPRGWKYMQRKRRETRSDHTDPKWSPNRDLRG